MGPGPLFPVCLPGEGRLARKNGKEGEKEQRGAPMSSENVTPKPDRLLTTLQRLLELDATDVSETLQKTVELVTQALGIEKLDVFLSDAEGQSLVAQATSTTAVGNKQKAIGLDRLPMTNGGRIVEVYLTGQLYWTGQAHRDPRELRGMTEDLGIKSELVVPLEVDGERRGVLFASSIRPDFFAEEDLHFLEAISHWVGVVLHRAELVEKQTSVARGQAREEAAEELLLVVAHDLRNYLTPLNGWLDRLERHARREKQEWYIQGIEAAQRTVRRLHALISDLLDVARLDKGMFALDLQPMNLVDLVTELPVIWSTQEHLIEVQAPDKLIISADRDRIEQVLENLLSNAITYADPGTPIQVVIAQERRGDEDWATVTVSNRGPEIPPELFASIFQPFMKGKHSKGLGLGLSLAERIAHAHRGTLTVHNGEERTTHFTLALPLAQDGGSNENGS